MKTLWTSSSSVSWGKSTAWPTMTSSWCWQTLTWRSRWGFWLFSFKDIGNTWKNWKILGNCTAGLHVRHVRGWCRTWSLLKDKRRDSKRNFQELGSYVHFLQLRGFRNGGFLLGWWADTIKAGPHVGSGFNVAPGILKHIVWLLSKVAAHYIWTVLPLIALQNNIMPICCLQ